MDNDVAYDLTKRQRGLSMSENQSINVDVIAYDHFNCYRAEMIGHLRKKFPFVDADDVVQTVLMKAWKNRHNFPWKAYLSTEPDSLRSWLFKILYTSRSDVGRTVQRQEKVNERIKQGNANSEFGVGQQINGVDNKTPITLTRRQERNERLLELMEESLSNDENEVLRYFYWDDFSVKEIAQELEIQVDAVKKRLSRARKKLAMALEEAGTKLSV